MTWIYTIVISPLEYLLELVFETLYRLMGNMPMTLLFLSLAVSLLTLPLYLNAEKIQSIEKGRQQAMSHWTGHIKSTFRGDERMMMIFFYQRIMGYSSISAVKGIIPLFLQIPFFIAAYHFLSSSELLKSAQSAVLGNLGVADELLCIGDIRIHALPVLMTLINCVSGAVYTKKGSKGEKIQVFLPAVVFLILLYPMPAGLVLYWTFNNLFSLLKNIYMDLPSGAKKKALYIPVVLGVVFLMWSFTSGKLLGYIYSGSIMQAVALVLLGLCFFLPLILSGRKKGKEDSKVFHSPAVKEFFLPAAAASLIMGALVPLKLIAASPLEFVNIFDYISPFLYVVKCICVSAGAFILWGSIVWGLSDNKGRWVVTKAVEILALAFAVDYFLFGAVEGRVSSSLVFEDAVRYEPWQQIINILLLIVMTTAVVMIRSEKIRQTIFIIGVSAVILMAVTECIEIRKELDTLPEPETGSDTLGVLPLCRNGRNVIVFMLDRAISAYVPYIFEEKPELKEAFDGFCWYPDTVSHGGYTIFGMPSLFGGYEYTPAAINAKTERSVAEDLDEALKVMPVEFGEAGFDVTVCDPPYAGFSELSDISIYNDIPYVKAYRMWGRYSAGNGDIDKANEFTGRNFVYYSLMEVLPQSLRTGIYDNGHYLGREKAGNVNGAFMDSYREMQALTDMTLIRDEGDSFIMLANNITHSPQMLKKPEYEPTDEEQEQAGGSFHTAGKLKLDTSMYLGEDHYDVNMAAFIQLAGWFDMMREAGVYDNSRIVLVADHGWSLGQFDELVINDELDAEGFNPLLMVKDFNARGFTVSDEFMTNADTPALAMEGVIERPVNPFSGNEIDMSGKQPYVLVTLSDKLSLGSNTGNMMDTEGAPWYRVQGSIFDKKNWEKVR